MGFPGLKDAQDRADVIAYLKTQDGKYPRVTVISLPRTLPQRQGFRICGAARARSASCGSSPRRCRDAAVLPSQTRLFRTIFQEIGTQKRGPCLCGSSPRLQSLSLRECLPAAVRATGPRARLLAPSQWAMGPRLRWRRQGTGQTVAMAVDQDALSKAVERLRITKKKKDNGPYEQAGADLNSDGRAKALVLFTGQDWCSPQGCTLVVFEPGEVGFRPISQTIGVKSPIAAGPSSNAGWRDLIVKTGGSKIVRLQFTGGGYPANAAGQADASADVAQSEVLIQPQAGGSQTAAAVSPPSGGQARNRRAGARPSLERTKTMDIDDLEPRKAPAKPKDLSVFSIEDLRAYADLLRGEIERTEAMIAKKSAQLDAAASIFRSNSA